MKTIPLSPKQQAQLKAMQQQQAAYMQAIIDAQVDVDVNVKWALSPDCSVLTAINQS